MRHRVTLVLVASLTACIQTEPEQEPAGHVQLGIVENLFDDAKRVDLGDLIWGTGRIATDGINEGLRQIPYSDTRLSYTEMFGLQARADEDLTIRSLPEIATGLATRFGESTLPAEVAAIRQRHLEQSDDTLYAETGFQIGGTFDHGISQSAPGLAGDDTGWIGVGFQAGANVEARVVTAHKNELDALRRAPLDAVMNVRGFIVPRDVDDIRDGMKPGESLGMGGRGRLGLNFGVGVPLLVANPLESITYSIVLSAGASTLVSGDLDVQIVRLEGDTAILDVGLRNAQLDRAYVRIDDSFGVSGLVRSNVSIGPFNIDLGKLAQKALEKELNRRLNLIAARAEGSQESVRESVARFRIDLGQVGQAGRVAIEEAMKGDVRLAQALASRGEQGLTTEESTSCARVARPTGTSASTCSACTSSPSRPTSRARRSCRRPAARSPSCSTRCATTAAPSSRSTATRARRSPASRSGRTAWPAASRTCTSGGPRATTTWSATRCSTTWTGSSSSCSARSGRRNLLGARRRGARDAGRLREPVQLRRRRRPGLQGLQAGRPDQPDGPVAGRPRATGLRDGRARCRSRAPRGGGRPRRLRASPCRASAPSSRRPPSPARPRASRCPRGSRTTRSASS